MRRFSLPGRARLGSSESASESMPSLFGGGAPARQLPPEMTALACLRRCGGENTEEKLPSKSAELDSERRDSELRRWKG